MKEGEIGLSTGKNCFRTSVFGVDRPYISGGEIFRDITPYLGRGYGCGRMWKSSCQLVLKSVGKLKYPAAAKSGCRKTSLLKSRASSLSNTVRSRLSTAVFLIIKQLPNSSRFRQTADCVDLCAQLCVQLN